MKDSQKGFDLLVFFPSYHLWCVFEGGRERSFLMEKCQSHFFPPPLVNSLSTDLSPNLTLTLMLTFTLTLTWLNGKKQVVKLWNHSAGNVIYDNRFTLLLIMWSAELTTVCITVWNITYPLGKWEVTKWNKKLQTLGVLTLFFRISKSRYQHHGWVFIWDSTLST